MSRYYSEIVVDSGQIHRMLDDLVVVRHIVLIDIHRLDEVVTALMVYQLVHYLLQFSKDFVSLSFSHQFLVIIFISFFQ